MKGEAFDVVARAESSGPSAAFGGKLGCLRAGDGLGAETLLEAAKKLAPGRRVRPDPKRHAASVAAAPATAKLEAANLERRRCGGRFAPEMPLYVGGASDQALRAFATELVKQTHAGAKLEDVTRVARTGRG